MKIQCNVCEAAEAAVLCCADEAALCRSCDEKVHAANKLAGKHQRVPLSGYSSSMPKCDICQEASGFFFCLQDRALLCRKCDVAIHTANTHVSSHQRFLLTGIRVELESSDSVPSSSSAAKSQSNGKTTGTKSSPAVYGAAEPQKMSLVYDHPQGAADSVDDFILTKAPFPSSGSAAGSIPQWQLDDILGLTDFDQSFEYIDNNRLTKADTSRRGDSDSSSMMRSAAAEEEEDEMEDEECVGKETYESSWAVPEIPSPPTASGLNWPKSYYPRRGHSDVVFVPDISSTSSVQTCSVSSYPSRRVGKRRRRRF
ncbi:PREDICTED: B-box zinc finger protein 22-like [Tarenaya hassleriana]|uniref:B-box zinc finger protein 22-like n=1 Tax=Tarenaya hassleriana TaxID=28532 RepID=UPI00053C62DA|nr:PREDICTED: B-box zinc finger protein 22-like [Tarenaya hassleriana]